MSQLPTDYDERKGLPLWTFLMEYFPLAFLALVRISVAGDKQHLNNSESGKIRWARDKSTDQLNTALRHQFDYGTGQKYDIDGHPHLGKAMWRLGAQLQLDEEERLGIKRPKPLAFSVDGDPHRPPSICSDCGVDLEEQAHAAGCLRLNRQPY